MNILKHQISDNNPIVAILLMNKIVPTIERKFITDNKSKTKTMQNENHLS